MASGCLPNANTLHQAVLNFLYETSLSCFSAALSYLENIDSLDNILSFDNNN
jgi:hypothetical protein